MPHTTRVSGTWSCLNVNSEGVVAYPGSGKKTRPMQLEDSLHSLEDLSEMKRRLRWAFLGKESIQENVRCISYLSPCSLSPSLSHEGQQDMPNLEGVFGLLENYYTDITAHFLDNSGIEEVLRDIACLGAMPSQEKYRFQERAGLILKGWSWWFGGYVEGSALEGLGDMNVNSPVLHDMLRARKRCTGSVGGIRKVVVETASGRSTSVTLPYS